ncbi:TM0996/MTH895 family glutaredoxin-like protein [bacterium]|nr:TM0996/MTH895 family glutaredoxin-like protein [bacterium]
MKTIKILGTGCPKCNKLAKNAEAAVHELGVDCKIEKVTDINAIMAHGVMMTPALVIDDEVKIVGKVATTDEIKKLIA